MLEEEECLNKQEDQLEPIGIDQVTRSAADMVEDVRVNLQTYKYEVANAKYCGEIGLKS